MCGLQDQYIALSVLLPLETLQHVADLQISCSIDINYSLGLEGDFEWPHTWGELTSLSRLDFLLHSVVHRHLPSPDLLAEMKGLVDVKLSGQFCVFDAMGEGYLLLLIGNLPLLSRLQIDVTDFQAAEPSESQSKEAIFGRLHHICEAVSLKVPEMRYIVGETDRVNSHVIEHRLVITMGS